MYKIKGEIIMKEKEITDLPMDWYKFWKYFRFPAVIILLLYNFFNALINGSSGELEISEGKFIIDVIIDIFIIIFTLITYISFCNRDKTSYSIFICYLFGVELVLSSIIDIINNENLSDIGIFYLIMVGLIWILPNYIYFSKRKAYFNKENDENYAPYDDTAVTKLVEKLEEESNQNQEQASTSSWYEYLERTFPNKGTRTNMQDILVQKAPTIETENHNQDIDKIEENLLPVANNIQLKVPPTSSPKKEKKHSNSKKIYIILLIIETIILAVFRGSTMYSKNTNKRKNKLFTIKSGFIRTK